MVSYTTKKKNVTSFITGTNIYMYIPKRTPTVTITITSSLKKKCNGEDDNYDNDNDVI